MRRIQREAKPSGDLGMRSLRSLIALKWQNKSIPPVQGGISYFARCPKAPLAPFASPWAICYAPIGACRGAAPPRGILRNRKSEGFTLTRPPAAGDLSRQGRGKKINAGGTPALRRRARRGLAPTSHLALDSRPPPKTCGGRLRGKDPSKMPAVRIKIANPKLKNAAAREDFAAGKNVPN